MKETERLEQGKACHRLLVENPTHAFCQHKEPLLAQIVEGANQAFVTLTRAEAELIRERKEANEALNALTDKALYYGELLKIELPHLDEVRTLVEPTNTVEKSAYADKIIDLIDTYKDSLYFQEEALQTLLPLDAAYDKESGESNTAKETYHKQVAAKDSALSALMQMINDVRRFTRRVFGLQSRQYQSVKDDVFSRPAKKEEPKGSDDPTPAPTPA